MQLPCGSTSTSLPSKSSLDVRVGTAATVQRGHRLKATFGLFLVLGKRATSDPGRDRWCTGGRRYLLLRDTTTRLSHMIFSGSFSYLARLSAAIT